MNLKDALGLGPYDGKTVLPVSIWVPVLVLFSGLAGALLASVDGEGALTQLVVAVVTGVVVVGVATGITLWRDRRR
jgi:heme O synthase-like polyprenyltransferase